MRCPRCSTEVREPAACCPSCGTSLLPESLVSGYETLGREPAAPGPRADTPRPPSSRSTPKARFLPGQLVSGRYRIIAVLGTGGMGEVYRADDLVLEQQVALKFLRAEIGADPTARERFVSEVKLARAVSHPNVCRVHDLGEVDGMLYLSMEYVDGEDLAALLRRIGAPSEKKALEIASQLCAGLAAAHARGVLHRDLKPANVMIDGAGMVRITDFGLAILAGEERGRGLVEGTPAYMAPEQLAGGEATAKSDVYALGLVLYELFTNVRVWQPKDLGHLRELHATRTPESPSTHGLRNERIERAILSCLERDPGRRPRSATSVAVALSGADPIAAALAAGETPTPEMVAASGGEGTISMTAAGVALAAIFALLAALMYVAPRASQYGYAALKDEPAVLAHRAREILDSLGLAVPDGDRAFGLVPIGPAPASTPTSHGIDVLFWYREAPFSLQPAEFDWRVSPDDPPLHWPGMVSLGLSMSGKLRWLEAIPPTLDPTRSGAHCDWEPVFEAAGLKLADFKPCDPSEPTFTPPLACDEQASWLGPDPWTHGVGLVGGAGFRGKPVFFGIDPWVLRSGPRYFWLSNSARLAQFWMWLPALIGGIVLARRNLARGRGDRRAAARLALVAGLGLLCVAFLRTNHTADLLVEQWLLVQGLSYAVYGGAFGWVLYLALEPAVRRIWPDHWVSWSRLLSGRWRDPLVSRDLLVGLCAGMLLTLVGFTQAWLGLRLDAPQATPAWANFPDAAGLRATIAQLCQQAVEGIAEGFLVLFCLVVLRFLVRRSWIAYVLLAPLLLFANDFSFTTGLPVLDTAARLLMAVLFIFVVARFGFIALVATEATFYFLNQVPLTNDMSAWYASQTIFAAIVVCGLALAAARLATGKRVVFT
jgi:tRNA A-37 threonylcarbamoyl transferase component Bud32